jgi:hypothetical protein
VPRGASRERGQVVVIFALLLPVILTIGSVVVSVGDWYVHKKHLQTLVDSGAFASGQYFTGCFQDPAGTNGDIAAAALKYAGDLTRDPTTQNRQYERPANAHVVLNSTTYWGGNPYPADNTLGLPCTVKYLDVKATDDQVPALFKWLQFAPSPKAKTRIEMHKVLGLTGLLPFAVPEVLPQRVAAVFVNEDTGNVVGASLLNNNTPMGGPDLSAFNVWHGDVGGVNLNGNENFNVVIVSSRDPSFTPATSGSLAAICNSNPAQTTCYGKPWSSTSNRVGFIHSYSDASSGGLDPPAVRQVELSGGCPEDLSSPYFNLIGGCSIGVSAKIDFGNSGDPRPYPACAVVSVNGSPMSWGSVSGDPYGRWTGAISVASGSGRNNVTINWQTDKGGGDCGGGKNNGAFTRVAAPYASNTNSGPVQYLTMVDNATGLPANSINPGGSSSTIHVTVGLAPPLSDADPLDSPILLRFGSPSGSQNQAVDCDKTVNFRDEILSNCQNPYIENDRNGNCSGYGPGNLPVPPIGPLPGDDCLITETGDKTGQIRQAMDERWGRNGGPTCQTLNHWPNAVGDPMPDPLTDTRFVTLFITDENSFGGSGNDIYPIRRFAGFYITAADGLNCPGDVPANPGAKNVWGHWVSYVIPSPGGIPDTELCPFTDGGVCIPLLVE